jgi:hypothetical protein
MMKLFILSSLIPGLLLAYSSNPPNGKTGAPGEGTCISCHSSFSQVDNSPDLLISGPGSYLPGQSYEIEVNILHPGQQRWGFELTPLDQGSITISDAVNTQMDISGGRSYVKQTNSGTHSGTADGPVSWIFNWTAPDNEESEVVFYAAANAANGNFGTSGDYIHTKSLTIQKALALPAISDLLITKDNNLNTLNWSAVMDAGSYNIYASNQPYSDFQLIGNTVLTVFEENNSSQHRYYQITAIAE